MQDTSAISIADYALNYASEFGWAVFPCHSISDDGFCTCGKADCKSEGKHPRTSRGSLDATHDESEITAYFAGGSLTHNIGVATGGVSNLVVVDVDTVKGADVNELIIPGIDQMIFNTFKVKTGAGLHFYYRLPVGQTVKNSASRLGKFIDVRGDGGYVIAPPSKHVSGRRYELLNPNPNDIEILDFPQAWLDKLAQPVLAANGNGNGANGHPSNGGSPFVIPAVQPGIILPDSIDQGKRNVELTAIAGALRDKGLSEGAIYAALAIENQRICKPPLDDKEVHQIAHSIGRYKPKSPLDPVSDDPNAPDYENTLKISYYKDFRTEQFVPKEVLALHIGKGDVAMLTGATNAGKSTLLRNILMCMAAGRPFMPFFDGSRPIKTAYFDLETDEEDLQADTAIMEKVFTPDELRLLGENLLVIPKGMLEGELFQFNTHEESIAKLINQEEIEFVVVDNVSAAFDLRDENSGSEVTKKVMKPLSKLAYMGKCGMAFAHHFGKMKVDAADKEVHTGRGSSSFANLSRAVFNIYGNVSKGEPATVYCAKRKTDGGQTYEETFKLKEDRWFHHTLIVASTRPKSCMEAIVDLLKAQQWRKVAAKTIVDALEKTYHRATIFRTLKDGQRIKMIETANGKYWLAGSDDEDEDND